MKDHRSIGCWSLLVALLSAVSSPAAEIVLQPVADASLFELQPDFNSGGANLAVGRINSPDKARTRALLRFDPAAVIPAGAVVTFASLTVTVSKEPAIPPAPAAYRLHRLLASWNEGIGAATGPGEPAGTNEVTWNSRGHNVVAWSLPGGGSGVDYATVPSSVGPVSALGLYQSYTLPSAPALVADVQAWLDQPAVNFGWLLLSTDESTPGTARRLASREYLPASSRPTLTIRYLLPPAVRSIRPADGRHRIALELPPNQTHTLEYHDSPGSPGSFSWLPLTNFPALPALSTQEVSLPFTGSYRFYRVVAP